MLKGFYCNWFGIKCYGCLFIVEDEVFVVILIGVKFLCDVDGRIWYS